MRNGGIRDELEINLLGRKLCHGVFFPAFVSGKTLGNIDFSSLAVSTVGSISGSGLVGDCLDPAAVAQKSPKLTKPAGRVIVGDRQKKAGPG